ncbi:diphthine--ammonia ligase [Methanofollis formosanus]|uniref:Diphthine--ammonia ligase n=1 Tax=Methanofollis formosanus TaxID=299308 RepID=A0A8G1EHK8_9EURY|nr:diphthine--ammonia ligase [Methanofollis formosanus]QYZ80117.1 diphthine--ammonia ligase [Methanofollis formosanus]
MTWAALTSGGKDSVLAVQRAIDAGIEVSALVTVRPENPHSYMFHSANLDAVRVMAEVAGMEYHEIPSAGKKEEEIVEMEEGLAALGLDGIVTGAVASTYQRSRLEAIAGRLGMQLYAPLWHMDYAALLREVAARLDAIIVVCAAEGLTEEFLGAHIDDATVERLLDLERRYRINPAGEGGEYESLTLDAPFFSRPLTYASAERRSVGDRHELLLKGFA